MRSALIIVICLTSILFLDQLVFEKKRAEYDGGSVSEAFIRKGVLGDLLRNSGLLSISKDTEQAAVNNLCATDRELKGFDYHNSFRLRLKIKSYRAQLLDLVIEAPANKNKAQKIHSHQFSLEPKTLYYQTSFNAEPGMAIHIRLSNRWTGQEVILEEAGIDGYYGRKLELVVDKKTKKGVTVEFIRKSDNSLPAIENELALGNGTGAFALVLPSGISEHMFVGNFPGKKNQGYCQYQANQISKTVTVDDKLFLAKVDIRVEPAFLTGERGILTNKEHKGREYEAPARLVIDNQGSSYNQAVGLRFHGGGPGRTKDINSYRVYARNDYGRGGIPHQIVFGDKRDKDLKTVVFKYTYQSYYDQLREYFNPFNHALALDIAKAIGALVPSYGLVDLSVNGENEGVFLAIEHLSDRTVKHWLGHDNFISVIYKKNVAFESKRHLSRYFVKIKNLNGEASFSALQQYYDIDNVINSIILSAYIADDDFCQGMDFVDLGNEQIVSINWDLDHAFLQWHLRSKRLIVTANRPGFPLLNPDYTERCPTCTKCTRSRVYGWVYSQSKRFRELVRARLEKLLNAELSPANIDTMLDYYRRVNQQYYYGEQSAAIADLQQYAKLRPEILKNKLSLLESHYD